ncbi:hypothetical protein [Actinomycetospora atypica]|uniref:Uncharacterized protein n=1 Tax=Actinomycetospora atypica TaxID=1290095 RepID=A0ABV9YMW0_9PSEU
MTVPDRNRPGTPSSSCDSRACPHCSASARALVEELRSVLAVSYVPLAGLVAVLDTTSRAWVLSLDTDSPAGDHCWALLEVLEVLAYGVDAAGASRTVPAPRVAPD